MDDTKNKNGWLVLRWQHSTYTYETIRLHNNKRKLIERFKWNTKRKEWEVVKRHSWNFIELRKQTKRKYREQRRETERRDREWKGF